MDAVILVSGSVSGYGGDDCRTAAAHAIYSSLTIFPEVPRAYHGEIAAFGMLAQLCMEGTGDEEVKTVVRYYWEVGLPFTLKQLGDITVTIEDMANMPFEVTSEMVISAVSHADKIGNEMVLVY
ncbi:hypothetical protein ACFVHQ_16920 [Actinomycetes bacterium NPDC127524]